MSILSTVKKGYMTIKTASGYVKLLPRTLATLVAMSDGKSVEEKITELNSKLSEFHTNQSTSVTFTPKYNCNAFVSYEADGWGYDGSLWQLEINATSATKPTKAMFKRAVFDGHNGTYSYGKGWSYFTGLKAGTTYTFTRQVYAGSGGGETNVVMTIQIYY